MLKDNLKLLREERNISQKQLAEYLHVSYKTISHWENGVSEPSINLIIALKRYFNCDYEELIE